jgi:hypothetical protein
MPQSRYDLAPLMEFSPPISIVSSWSPDPDPYIKNFAKLRRRALRAYRESLNDETGAAIGKYRRTIARLIRISHTSQRCTQQSLRLWNDTMLSPSWKHFSANANTVTTMTQDDLLSEQSIPPRELRKTRLELATEHQRSRCLRIIQESDTAHAWEHRGQEFIDALDARTDDPQNPRSMPEDVIAYEDLADAREIRALLAGDAWEAHGNEFIEALECPVLWRESLPPKHSWSS